MENTGTERTTVSLSRNIDSASKAYAKDKGLKFSTVVGFALEHFLKSEGFVFESNENEIFDIVREMLADGHTSDEIEAHLLKLGRKEVA